MKRPSLVAIVAAVLLAACSPGSDPGNPQESASESPTAASSGPTDVSAYLSQDVQWRDCPGSDEYLDVIPDDAECATVKVPVDYFTGNAGRGDLQIAVVRIPAEGEAQGDMLVNPGGPGGSGFDYAVSSADDFRKNLPGFNIIGFDPRGVQRSAGFDCEVSTKERLKRIESDFSPESAEEYDDIDAFISDYEEKCRAAYPAWAFLGTASVARDMRVISQAITGAPLNYFGVSYGTELGYEYLRAFPDDIGRMILESPVDPSVEEVLVDQLEQFNDRIEELLVICANEKSDSCGKGRSVDEVRADFEQALRDVEDPRYRTLSSAEGPSERMVYYGMLLPLYWEWKPQYTNWYLEAVSALINDQDATFFEFWGYLYEGYDLDSRTFTQAEDILELVRCLDVSTDPAEMDLAEEKERVASEREQVRERAPLFYALAFEGEWDDDRTYDACSFAQVAFQDETLPDPVPEALPVSNPEGVPVLLLGISGDTATPYAWAKSVAEGLGVPLITQDATGHAIYSSSDDSCTRDVVVAYLESGEVPDAPVTCR